MKDPTDKNSKVELSLVAPLVFPILVEMTPRESALIKKFRKLSPEGKAALIEVARQEAERARKKRFKPLVAVTDCEPAQDSLLVTTKGELDSPGRLRAIEKLNEVANAYGIFEMPTGQATYDQAVCFLNTLPASVTIPEISVDPDEEFTFDWIQDRKMLSVSLGASGQLSIAADIDGEVFADTPRFDGELPVEFSARLTYFGQP